jgi:hypothetical protein
LEALTEENVVRLIETPRGILAFAGVAHLINEGHVLRLIREGNRWVVDSMPLPAAPVAVLTQNDGAIMVATNKYLVRITQQLDVELLHRFAESGGLWESNSIAQDKDGTLYIGMGFAVRRLRPRSIGYAEDWLAPKGIPVSVP